MIRQACFLLVVCSLLTATDYSRASIVISITDNSGNLTVTATGSLNTTGLMPFPPGGSNYSPGIISGGTSWYIGPGSGGAFENYQLATFSVPFGTSTTQIVPDSSTGDSFFLFGSPVPNVGLPAGYVSGAAINSQMTFNNTSLADLGLTAGNYLFTLPTGDEIGLFITGVPEPSLFSTLGFLFAVTFIRRKRR